MSEAFVGDIKVVAFGFAPRGWALCNGQLLPISQNQPLFSLLGTMYGGDGRTTFGLPDLRARIPLHNGGQYQQGQQGGEATHTLNLNEIPAHTHSVIGVSSAGTVSQPSAQLLAGAAQASYGNTLDLGMNPVAARPAGNSQPHPNMPPFLGLNFIICLSGIFPSRN
jgi:microcystin-dependent protein